MRTVTIAVVYAITPEFQQRAAMTTDACVPVKQTVNVDFPLDVALRHKLCTIGNSGGLSVVDVDLLDSGYWTVGLRHTNAGDVPTLEEGYPSNHRATFGYFLTPEEASELVLTSSERYAAWKEALKLSPEWAAMQEKCDKKNSEQAAIEEERRIKAKRALELLHKFLGDPAGSRVVCKQTARYQVEVSEEGSTESFLVPACEISMQLGEKIEATVKKFALDKLVFEVSPWVLKHGSSRLKKAHELGLLGQSIAVYRDERLALEMPGWSWIKNLDLDEESEILNPSEDVLNAYAEAQKTWGVTVELSKWQLTKCIGPCDEYGDKETHKEWVPVLSYHVAWASQWAVRVLD